jgi:two-component system, OmpR family, alkaline phosphatase synthesis response regulator PhoP
VPKVVLADDEPHIRLLLEQTLEELEDLGVELIIARNGEEALNLIKSERPELVFLDIMMPRMSGYDVCAAIRNTPGMKDVHIILLTAKGQEVDREQGRRAGADLYMTKPFDPDELRQKAVEILKLDVCG